MDRSTILAASKITKLKHLISENIKLTQETFDRVEKSDTTFKSQPKLISQLKLGC